MCEASSRNHACIVAGKVDLSKTANAFINHGHHRLFIGNIGHEGHNFGVASDLFDRGFRLIETSRRNVRKEKLLATVACKFDCDLLPDA